VTVTDFCKLHNNTQLDETQTHANHLANFEKRMTEAIHVINNMNPSNPYEILKALFPSASKIKQQSNGSQEDIIKHNIKEKLQPIPMNLKLTDDNGNTKNITYEFNPEKLQKQILRKYSAKLIDHIDNPAIIVRQMTNEYNNMIQQIRTKGFTIRIPKGFKINLSDFNDYYCAKDEAELAEEIEEEAIQNQIDQFLDDRIAEITEEVLPQENTSNILHEVKEDSTKLEFPALNLETLDGKLDSTNKPRTVSSISRPSYLEAIEDEEEFQERLKAKKEKISSRREVNASHQEEEVLIQNNSNPNNIENSSSSDSSEETHPPKPHSTNIAFLSHRVDNPNRLKSTVNTTNNIQGRHPQESQHHDNSSNTGNGNLSQKDTQNKESLQQHQNSSDPHSHLDTKNDSDMQSQSNTDGEDNQNLQQRRVKNSKAKNSHRERSKTTAPIVNTSENDPDKLEDEIRVDTLRNKNRSETTKVGHLKEKNINNNSNYEDEPLKESLLLDKEKETKKGDADQKHTTEKQDRASKAEGGLTIYLKPTDVFEEPNEPPKKEIENHQETDLNQSKSEDARYRVSAIIDKLLEAPSVLENDIEVREKGIPPEPPNDLLFENEEYQALFKKIYIWHHQLNRELKIEEAELNKDDSEDSINSDDD